MKNSQVVKKILAVKKRYFGVGLVLVTLFLLTSTTLAQTGGSFELVWSTVDGGGGIFNNNTAYSLQGTAGQPDADSLNGGGYTLVGGFWNDSVSVDIGDANHIYLPLVLR